MTGRPLRKDAAERRAAILRAARDVFAREGLEAPLDHIAEQAGVGRATLYRNFPGRTEMTLAVLLDDIAELEAKYQPPLDADAFIRFLTDLSDRLTHNVALGGVVRASPSPDILLPLRQALVQAARPALLASQAAGTVRPDLTTSDLRVLSSMLGAGLHNAGPDERRAIAARTLSLVLDAVRERR